MYKVYANRCDLALRGTEMAYYCCESVTKEVLDKILVGALVKVNDWRSPMRVVGVSENYFCMVKKCFGKTLYSVCEKKLWSGIRYNKMVGGMFHVGTDNMVFGAPGFDYEFKDPKQIKKYLEMFESGGIELSVRSSVPIYRICIKS